jgi:hypothetical protein
MKTIPESIKERFNLIHIDIPGAKQKGCEAYRFGQHPVLITSYDIFGKGKRSADTDPWYVNGFYKGAGLISDQLIQQAGKSNPVALKILEDEIQRIIKLNEV